MRNPNIVSGFAAGLTASILLTGCSSEAPSPESTPAQTSGSLSSTPNEVPGTSTATYLPTWGADSRFNAIASISGIGHINIAFAVPKSDGEVSVDLGSPAALNAIRTLGHRATGGVSLAVGGWGGSDAEHADILAGFDRGLHNPATFAGTISKTVADVEKQTGLPDIGVDIDMEYPTAQQAQQLPALVEALHSDGIKEVSMAVPASANAEPTQRVAKKLAKLGVKFNVMTYDLHGPWEPKAGPITDIRWIMESLSTWIQATGDESIVNAGLPTYGYPDIGASKAGDAYNVPATNNWINTHGTVHAASLKPADIISDPKTMTSSAVVKVGNKKAWTSIVTPSDAANMVKRIHDTYPNVGVFTWEAGGMTQRFANALKG